MDLYMEIINITVIPLNIMGIHPTKKLGYFRIFAVCLSSIIIIYLVNVQFTYREFTWQLFVGALESTFIPVHGMLKILSIISKKEAAKHLLKDMEKFWDVRQADPNIRDEVLFDILVVKRIVQGFFIMGAGGILVFYLRPLYMDELPIMVHIPESIPFPIFLIYIMAKFAIYGYMVVGFDTFAFSIVLILTVQFKMLNEKFKSINFGNINNEYDIETCKKQIKEYVDHHNLLYDYLDTFNDFISTNAIVQFFLTTSLTCSELLVASKNLDDVAEAARSTMTLMMHAFQLSILYCWPAEKLQTEASKTIFSIYESDWTSFHNTSIRKELILIMQRAQSNAGIFAGKVYPVNFATCTKIFNTSFSVFTCINALGQKKA